MNTAVSETEAGLGWLRINYCRYFNRQSQFSQCNFRRLRKIFLLSSRRVAGGSKMAI